MITLAKDGIYKPKVFAISTNKYTKLTNGRTTLFDKKWKHVMQEEYDTLQKIHGVIGYKWIFWIKHNVDDIIVKYEARFLALWSN